ncbi:MAG: alpha-amylase family glycosyl hydrolase [Pseudoflavonifractor sp.]|nr:alpha-amylase family glycosyl hydrolase [Pseudoflavonifractor sp.]
MKQIYSILCVAVTALLLPSITRGQVVTTSPAIVQTDSKDIVITFHADEGNKALAGVTADTKVYAHTGVITSLSKSDSDWKYAPTWGTNTEKYEMTYIAPDTWTLTIPDIDEYYGITSPDEVVEKMAFVFRTADNKKEGKTADGGDIFVNVYPEGFQMQLTSDNDGIVVHGSTPVTFTVNTTAEADIAIYINEESDTPIASGTGTDVVSTVYTFANAGDYKVIAVATSDDGEMRQTLDICCLGEALSEMYPGGTPKMGPVANPDGSVTFCLAAPGKKSAIIVGSWDNYTISARNQMYYQDYEDARYFWITVDDMPQATDNIYYFIIDGGTEVGDPYARLVLDPWNDKYISSTVFPNLPAYPGDYVQGVPLAVYNSTQDDYNWEIEEFKGVDQSDLIIYELLIRDFTGTEGRASGTGTVKGVIDKLDYIKDLGVNAVELLPIMEFNGNNSWGYNTNFYFAPDKAYGTPNDYRRLVDECHKRGLAVILDIVFNQSDGLHPWYKMYPIAENPFYNGTAPHAYSVLNDWNQDNPLVQQQWHDALAYWMTEYKVDGFRFDLVKGLGNNDSYKATYNAATNTWSGVTDNKTNAYNATRVARMKTLHDAMRKVRSDAYFINENLAGAREENEMAKDDEINWANVNYASCQFAMGYTSGSDLNRFYAPKDSRTWGSTVSYAESHDEERMAYKQNTSGASGVKGDLEMSMRRLGSVAAQMLMAPGAHMIWQFQEFGADQTTKSASGDNNTSPKKVIWSYLDNEYRAGLAQSYRELCGIRSTYPSLFRQGVNTTMNCSGWANGRTIVLADGSSELICVVNPNLTGTKSVTVPMTMSSSGYKVLSASYGVEPVIGDKSVTIPAGAYAVIGAGDIAGIDGIEADIDGVKVYGSAGSIVICGDYRNADVYTIDGIRLGTEGLAPGIYIVNVDGKTYKVAVN